MTTDQQTTIETANDDALDTFWAAIVKHYPQAQTGDLSPGATFDLHQAAFDAVKEWVANNVHDEEII